ncbi:topoisomerase DNA-binding C4 zinc finger domain-containing protein [Halosimplex amylolyticum]|uniref:topoisomerase DNA-binding C4 zinc finger domain-containing protein n=1 Tax=Halosimplex amylolyticum TaxID=3396616 RepID=UPI003F559C3B
MHDEVRVVAGDCTTTFDGRSEREHRGDVVTVVKPDNTVLVHDADGYQPVAWLTRADSVQFADGVLDAREGDQRLRVEVHDEHGSARHPVSRAGVPVGDCPVCDGQLVLASGAVRCGDCDDEYSVPRDAAVLDETCPVCGLPLLRVERGEPFEVCVDRACESIDDRVTERFDREWDCPNCDGELRVLRRGGLIAGCEHYPDCDTGFGIPTGVVDGTCDCGLPVFETPSGRRCLDTGCAET